MMNQMTRFIPLLFCLTASVFLFNVNSSSAADEYKPTLQYIEWKKDSAPLNEFCKYVTQQTGLTIDTNRLADRDAPLIVKIPQGKKAIWPFLSEALLPLKIKFIADANKIILLENRPLPESVDGAFRTIPRQVDVVWATDREQPTINLTLNTHWQPTLAVYRIGSLKVVDQDSMKPINTDASKFNCNGLMQPLQLSLPADKKAININGQYTATVAEKILRFRFENLEMAKDSEQINEDVVCRLMEFRQVDNRWEATIACIYKKPLPTFESFESEIWLRDNNAKLISPDRTQQLPAKDFQVVSVNAQSAIIQYRWPAKKLGPTTAGWFLEAETPSTLNETTVKFELTGIPRP